MDRGLILQPTYRVRAERPVVQLYGRLDEGRPFLVEDDRFRPYFFVHEPAAAWLAARHDADVEATELVDLGGAPVSRVSVALPSAVPALREKLAERGLAALEADVRFPYRYLIDRGLRGAVEIRGHATTTRAGLALYRNPELHPARCRPELRALSIDLETTPDASRILSVALYGGGVEEVHLVWKRDVAGAQVHSDEATLLIAAATRIREIDPDLIVGWNVVDFDLRVFERRCSELRLPAKLTSLGRAGGRVTLQRDRGFTRQSRATLSGRMVLDGIALVRDALRLPDYRLETVARAVLGRGKLIDAEAPDSAAEIWRLYEREPEALVRYNLEDARLVLEILEREGLLALALERSLLTGMQLDRVAASIASFDLVYLPELRRRGVVAPSVDAERASAVVTGGAVLDALPGVWRNVALFDFKSLYPSLIRTFNLDPLAHARAALSADPPPIEAPNGARFSREAGILPEVIERFMERREQARERGDRHADQAIKIMMNAFFGVLAAASCRFFDPDIANAITRFGQQTLHWTREAFQELGVQVLYGDTDSVFVQLRGQEPGDRALAEAATLRDRAQTAIAERVRRSYGVEPRLTLELERVYERFFLPRLRGSSSGSKKRYAGWREGTLEVVGLESVRRDWPEVARRLQEGMLTRLFRDEEVLPFVSELVAQVRSGAYDEELVYSKRVRKASLEHYTRTTPPHIQAARKAKGAVGPVVRYVITDTGPELATPGRRLPPGIDRAHYVERVLRPIADAILEQIDSSFDEALGRPRQLRLL